MVGGLVKQQHVSIGNQYAGKINTAALTAGKHANFGIPIQIADHAVDDIADASIGCPFVFGRIAHHVPSNGLCVVQFICLAKRGKANTARSQHAAIIGFNRSVE